MRDDTSKFTFFRLMLSGALAGTAIVGIISPMLGYDASHTLDALGTVAGAGAVVAFKLAHLI